MKNKEKNEKNVRKMSESLGSLRLNAIKYLFMSYIELYFGWYILSSCAKQCEILELILCYAMQSSHFYGFPVREQSHFIALRRNQSENIWRGK